MSSYTMELKTIIEQASQYQENLSTKERIEIGRKKLFDFSYPIFDEKYRAVFETHFIRHYYMNEIGSETEGLFKFRLETWLNINMPYFNQLFLSEQIKFDPLKNTSVDMKHTKDVKTNRDDAVTSGTDMKANTKGQTTNKGSNDTTTDRTQDVTDDNFNRDLYLDTPQTQLNITVWDGQGAVPYATNINERTENNVSKSTAKDVSKNDTENTGTSNQDSTQSLDTNQTLNSDITELEDYVQHREGKIGVQTYSKMLTEYRQTFLRIERDIFEEMRNLFMLIY